MNPSRHGLKAIRVHFGTFDFSFICLAGPYVNVEKYVAWKFDDPGYKVDCPYEPRGRVFFRQGYVPVLWIPRRPRTAREHGTLAHEVLHVVGFLMEWADITYAKNNDEIFCHAVGHAVTHILEGLRA